MSIPRIILKPGREKPVLNRHPWIFSGAVKSVEGRPNDGDVVAVVDHGGHFLARGYLNRRSQIVLRLLTWDESQAIDANFWRSRLEQALARRQSLAEASSTDAYRLVNAESDLLPGLVVDRYAGYLVVQFLTLGVDRRREELVDILADLAGPKGIYERSDVDVRRKEGLAPSAGPLFGEPPPEVVEVLENGYCFLVDVRAGQKTGFYLDQRENRRKMAVYCAGREVLNGFAYTGAFAVYAAAAGALRVVNVDSSAEALNLARRNVALNGFGGGDHEYVVDDLFQTLRRYRDAGRRFGVVILDPPKFAYTQGQIEAACRGYKDINLLALKLIRPGGFLVTFSCSGLVSADLFQKVVFGASVEAGREAQIIERLSQGADHPVLLSFPEGEYLKGLICRVL